MEGMTLPSDNRVGPNCGVTAVAVAAGVPFETAWNLLAGIRNVNPKRWRGKSTVDDRRKALASLGVRFTEVPAPYRRTTLETWARCYAKPGRRYMVRTYGHVQIVQGRTVLDQLGAVPVSEYWGRRKYVAHILELTA